MGGSGGSADANGHPSRPYRPPQQQQQQQQPEVLVEVALREHLTYAHATPEYLSTLHASVPEVFVGTRSQLLQLVSAMATALSLSHTSQGLEVPPWRRRAALLSRWQQQPAARTALKSMTCLPGGSAASSVASSIVPAQSLAPHDPSPRALAQQAAQATASAQQQQPQQQQAGRPSFLVIGTGANAGNPGPSSARRAARRQQAAAPPGPKAPMRTIVGFDLGPAVGCDARCRTVSSESALMRLPGHHHHHHHQQLERFDSS